MDSKIMTEPNVCNVKVAVRIRSLNSNTPEKCVLQFQRPNTICILDDRNTTKKYDHVFWSYDGYRKTQNGYFEPDGQSDYADQKRVFDDIGKDLLNHLFMGFNCTLFAYGQTASGKSYTVMERGVNKGLLPRMIDTIFEKVKSNNNPDLEYQVSFSIMEIYNEKVYDLLEEVKSRTQNRTELEIMENKARNLSCVPVSDSNEVSGILEKGYKNRSIAATNMNQHSSRAHTVATIYLKQICSRDKTTRSSQMNVVDLAGSERVGKTNAEGDRLKEGSKINSSLLHLGEVIRALAKKGDNNTAKPIYRNSKLTLLLKDSLGGKSKTVMLATVSPLESNLSETKSTLTYAFDAKSITNNSKANEFESLDNTEVKELMEKLQRTKARLIRVNLEKKESVEEIEKLKAEIEALRIKLKEALTENKEPLPENVFTQDKRITTVPHLLNLNEDHMLSKLVRYYIEKDKCIYVGGNTTDFPEEQVLAVNEIGQIGQISIREGKVFLQTFRKNAVAINGKRIDTDITEQRLKSGDRLMFGSLRSLWVYVDPTANESCFTVDDINYDIAEDEIVMQSNTNETIPADSIALKRKLVERYEDVKEANFKSVLSNKPTVFSLALTSAYFLGINKENNVVIVKVWNRKNNCRYIWTENEFMQTMDDINAFKIDGENDIDPFNIKSDTFSPVGVSFIDMHGLGEGVTNSQRSSIILDEMAKHIGQVKVSLEVIQNVPTTNSMSIKIFIKSAIFDDSIREKYGKVKFSFRLPSTDTSISEEEEPEYIETCASSSEAPYFNFQKEIEISHVSNEKLILRLFGIPRQNTILYEERGDLAELVQILKEKDKIIERLREERDALKLKVAELTKAIQKKK